MRDQNKIAVRSFNRIGVGSTRRKREKFYEDKEFELNSGQALLMMSDGIKGQLGGTKSIPFGEKQLLKHLASGNYIFEGVQNAMNAIGEYKNKNAQTDDITLIALSA